MSRIRLDQYLLERGLIGGMDDAFIVVTEGRVFVNGQKAVSPSQRVGADDVVEVRGPREFVGRGAYKLAGALEAFGIDVAGCACADIGAATGGFTEVLLRRGARRVYAIDTARGKLDPKLRNDARVVVMEGTNALALASLPEPFDFISIDVSLTSLRVILPGARTWLAERGSVVALLKPQYEADPKDLRHGVVRDDAVRAKIIADFRAWLGRSGWTERGMIESPIRGSAGNTEYLFWLRAQGRGVGRE